MHYTGSEYECYINSDRYTNQAPASYTVMSSSDQLADTIVVTPLLQSDCCLYADIKYILSLPQTCPTLNLTDHLVQKPKFEDVVYLISQLKYAASIHIYYTRPEQNEC